MALTTNPHASVQNQDDGVLDASITAAATSCTISPVKKWVNGVLTTGGFNSSAGFVKMIDSTGRYEFASFDTKSVSATNITTLSGMRRGLSVTAAGYVAGTGQVWDANTRIYVCDYATMWQDLVDTTSTQTIAGTKTFTAPILITGSTSYTGVPEMTTAQRTALTPGQAGFVYDTDLGQMYKFEGGAWAAVDTGTLSNGSTTVAGKYEEATVAEQGTATATGATGARLVPAVANLVKTSSGASDENKIAILDATGKFATGFVDLSSVAFNQILTPKNGSVSSDYGSAAAALTRLYATTVAFDASATGTASATTLTFSHTCSSTANRVLLVGVGVANTGDVVTGITYGGVAMTRIGWSGNNSGHSGYMYGLLAPSTGANNVVITKTGTDRMDAVSGSYTGADQTRLYDATVAETSSTGTSQTTVLSTTSDNGLTVGFITDGNGRTFTAGANTTLRGNIQFGAMAEATAVKTPAGSVTLNWTVVGGSTPTEEVACDILAVTAGEYSTFDFDQTLPEAAVWDVVPPRSYTGGTVTAKISWLTTAASGDVVWKIQAVAVADNGSATAYGTAISVTDSANGANKVNITATTSAITVGGSPAVNVPICFRVVRDAASASDTLAADAKLISVEIQY
jgi:hypothetical protein